jgi:hypothetical protein
MITLSVIVIDSVHCIWLSRQVSVDAEGSGHEAQWEPLDRKELFTHKDKFYDNR